jgi:hypothetical protein
MEIIKDRFVLAGLALILFMAVVCVTATGTETENSISGMISDVKETDNGNTFTFTDTKGNEMRCFYRGTVTNGDVCTISGTYSDDGNIFFISSMRMKN